MTFARYPLGSIDHRTNIWAIGWAMLLGDGHLDKLGGYDAIESSKLFFQNERLVDANGQCLYYLQCTADPRDAGFRDAKNAEWRRISKFLNPLLPPPPFDPTGASRRE
jgi:hypothetical protein